MVSFLPCLVAFLGFHPYTVLNFFNVFLQLVSVGFAGGETFLADVLS